ncbi:MAG TPA: hypothetical protein VGW34_14330 [Allosphingosinicella sp.]|nr:hypothetical protein [Allosphingosinicella sp.]
MTAARPLRFLILLGTGWICVRTAMLFPSRQGEPVRETEAAEAVPSGAFRDEAPVAARVAQPSLAPAPALHMIFKPRPPGARTAGGRSGNVPPLLPEPLAPGRAAGTVPAAAAAPPPANPAARTAPAAPPFGLAPAVARASRWSGSAWMFVRRAGASPLAAAGTLGGSQAGARLSYRLNHDVRRPLSLSARLYSPLGESGAEAALGVEWQPIASLPVRLLAERRQALADGGRSAFSVLAYGGVSDSRLIGPVLLDGYAQAGMVGLRSRDLFIDGSAQLGIALDQKGRLKAGVGLWGAAQPGVARLDIGPQASVRMPVGGTAVRVAAEWRFRIAGDAEPASGPALTVATEF